MENLLSRTEMALLNKTWGNGLQNYTQSNCQCTLTDQGMRIYRPPNLTYPDCGNTIWGGLRIHPFELSDNILVKGHTYIIYFDVKGKTSNGLASFGWTNNMGWPGGGLAPSPSNISYLGIGENFNGSKTIFYTWTINDDVRKVCTTAYSDFVVGQTYISYRDFQFGFTYASTGSMGTDIYISNIRMYDITSINPVSIKKNGNAVVTSVVEGYNPCSFGNELHCNEIIEN